MTSKQPISLANLTPAELNEIPALSPPLGITPDFQNPEYSSPRYLIAATVLLGLMLGFYANRLYIKLFRVRKLSWDDRKCWVINSPCSD